MLEQTDYGNDVSISQGLSIMDEKHLEERRFQSDQDQIISSNAS